MLYLQRSEISSTIDCMICLIRCAVLLNAAELTTSTDANFIKENLKKLNQHLLESAQAKQIEVDLCKKAKSIKLSIEHMRTHVKKF